MAIRPVTHTLRLPGQAPTLKRPVRLVARDLGTSEVLARHTHAWGQATFALDGVLRVTVGNSTWIVPPSRAIWIPPAVTHEVEMLSRARLRVLYVHAERTPFAGNECEVIEVSELLRALIVALGEAEADSERETLLSALLLDELTRSPAHPIRVALPEDKRLRALCELLIREPGSSLTLDGWAAKVGASARTLSRLFERELGMGFQQWRQQVRLAHAALLVSRGIPLANVAAELGYTSQSAFSAMFKKTFGKSPSRFFMRKQ
jgi:AraC-like DNA-binding protein/mannose-6-phosphate isomerase-like protein (cupin superfamily)